MWNVCVSSLLCNHILWIPAEVGDAIKELILSRALIAAVRTDDDANIGKLALLGATNIDQALKEASDLRCSKAHAMLLMVQASLSGRVTSIQNLFGIFKLGSLRLPGDVLLAARRDISTAVPLRVAAENNHWGVYEELLMHTETNREQAKVLWENLNIKTFEAGWLQRVSWVLHLSLARNKLVSLPAEMSNYLKNVSCTF